METEFKAQVLRVLYEAFFLSEEKCDLKPLLQQEGPARKAAENLIERLSVEHLIEPTVFGGWFYQLKPRGVVYVEKHAIASADLVRTNDEARTRMLLALTKVYEEQGNLYMVPNSELYQEASLDQIQATANLLVLHGLGLAEPFGNGGSRLTHNGLDFIEEYRKNRSLANEFEAISNMSPQARGRALQKLIAKVAARHGWGNDEGVRTSNEEMDVIIYRDREYYLLESKWEKDPIEAAVVRELFGKLGNRIDVRGMVASMSGFSKGAVKQVEDYIAQRLILLLGSQDIRALVYGVVTLEELLNAKYKELVTKRRVIFN